MNNIGIRLAFLYLFLLMINIGYSQQKLEKELDSYAQEIKKRVILNQEKEEVLLHNNFGICSQ